MSEYKHKPTAVILVGCKVDLRHSGKRCISHFDALNFAQYHQIPYIETSAKDDINVEFLFQYCVYTAWFQHAVEPSLRLQMRKEIPVSIVDYQIETNVYH